MRKLKLGFWTACMAGMLAMPALATTRNWTGANSGNWSDPNNWSPGGTPADGDYLQFGMVSDAHRTMNNDIAGLEVANVVFIANDYTLNGYTLLLNGAVDGGIDGDVGELTAHSYTVTINCALIFAGGGRITAHTGDGTFTQSTEQVFLNGPIAVDNGVLGFEATSEAVSSVGGGNGKIFATSQISGTGSVSAFASEVQNNVSFVEFMGSTGNTFAGGFYPFTQGKGQIILAKSAGVAVPNGLTVDVGQTANLVISGTGNQIGDHSTVAVIQGSTLNLSGNNVTVGTLVLTNNPSETLAATLDTGSTTLGLNVGITVGANSDQVNPIIKGTINLNGFLQFNVSGIPSATLEIPATIEGNGFQKTGNGMLLLEGNNTFFGDCEITAGSVEPTTTTAFGQAGPTYGVELNGGDLYLDGLAIGAEPLFVWSGQSKLYAFDQCSWAGPVTLNADLNVLPMDTTSSGKTMNFSGPISGVGGINFLDSPSYNGTLLLSGSSANTYTGTTTVYGRLLELGKPASVNACSGPIIVGGGSAAISETRWLNNYQDQFAAITLYANAYVNLNNHSENFGPSTFNGGTVDTGSVGQFAIVAPLTVNPSSSTATINGRLGLPPGYNAPLNVGAGSTPSGLDLVVNADRKSVV